MLLFWWVALGAAAVAAVYFGDLKLHPSAPVPTPRPPLKSHTATLSMEPGPVPAEIIPQLGHPPFDDGPRRTTVPAALENRWQLAIVYCDSSNEWTSRQVDPVWVGSETSGRNYGDNRFNLFGARCHLAKAKRRFRYDRVRAIEVMHPDQNVRDRYRVM